MGCSEHISFLFQNPNFKSLIYCVRVIFCWEHKGWKTKPQSFSGGVSLVRSVSHMHSWTQMHVRL